MYRRKRATSGCESWNDNKYKCELQPASTHTSGRLQFNGDHGHGANGGIDLPLAKGNEKFLMQCKQWEAVKVGFDYLVVYEAGIADRLMMARCGHLIRFSIANGRIPGIPVI